MKTLKTTLLIITISITTLTFAQTGNGNGNGNNNGVSHWRINGNSATSTNYIGTSNNQDLIFKSNNVEGLRLLPNADAKLMGDVVLDKLKFTTPVAEEQFLQIKNDGKIVSLDKSGLIDAIYNFQVGCLADENGYVHAKWNQQLNTSYGILYTGVGIANCNTKVGIGTNAPQARLDVRGTGYFSQNVGIGEASTGVYLGNAGSPDLGDGTSFIGFNVRRVGSTNGIWTTEGDGSANGGATIYGDIYGSLRFSTIPKTGGANQVSITDADVKKNTRLFIHKDGNIGIGTELVTDNYKLSVEGFIRARKVVVDAVGWADYVFASDYNLKPLSEVEKFIQENKHLPEVPSEKEVKETGIDLGEMDAILLKKIEELTLYILEQEKRIQQLENK